MSSQRNYKRSIFWFRRDLRLTDNCGLYQALKSSEQVFAVFVFDSTILSQLNNKSDRRVDFIYQSIEELRIRLRMLGSTLIVRYGDPTVEIPYLVQQFDIDAVFTNHDYESSAIRRDDKVKFLLNDQDIAFHTFKDQVIFEKQDILNKQNLPFTVFTPYKKAWLSRLLDHHINPYLIEEFHHKFSKLSDNLKPYDEYYPSLKDMGFESTNLSLINVIAGESGANNAFSSFKPKIQHYKTLRDFPESPATSRLSLHLRFGTISIRQLVSFALEYREFEGAQTWLSELIWREFFAMILANFPHVETESFQGKFRDIPFTNNETYFEKWCKGETGYPIVDAGMRELNQTGYMHNRVRMIVASFLVKDLHIDWRWGERYFAQHLLDYDLASNNGGWQWSASTGCDAQPYFRIFNPTLQSVKFDPKGKYIRKYVPELKYLNDKEIHEPYANQSSLLNQIDYSRPIVDHAKARQYTLDVLFKTNDKS